MELAPAGLVGAIVGLGVGLIDYAVIAVLIRKTISKIAERDPKSMPSQKTIDAVMKGVFVVTVLVFAGLGYWFGATIGG
jgi:hypothetical protein